MKYPVMQPFYPAMLAKILFLIFLGELKSIISINDATGNAFVFKRVSFDDRSHDNVFHLYCSQPGVDNMNYYRQRNDCGWSRETPRLCLLKGPGL
jgi:hypothetical protein